MTVFIKQALRTLRPEGADAKVPFLARPHAAGVDLRVLAEDGMQAGGESDTHYYLVGASALNAILAALSLARLPAPRTLLDFGAGAGRVLRWLRAAFPDARLTACDLREQDMDFCKEAFAADTFISGTDVSSLQADGTFDLIWAGSVCTHLPPASCALLLDKLMSWCAPDGLVVFSTIGRLPAAEQDGATAYHYSRWPEILRGYVRRGFGYADYDDTPGYGLALAKPSWFLAAMEKNESIRLVMFGEAVWNNHQDVWAVQKRAIASMYDATYGSRIADGTAHGATRFADVMTTRDDTLGQKLYDFLRSRRRKP